MKSSECDDEVSHVAWEDRYCSISAAVFITVCNPILPS